MQYHVYIIINHMHYAKILLGIHQVCNLFVKVIATTVSVSPWDACIHVLNMLTTSGSYTNTRKANMLCSHIIWVAWIHKCYTWCQVFNNVEIITDGKVVHYWSGLITAKTRQQNTAQQSKVFIPQLNLHTAIEGIYIAI